MKGERGLLTLVAALFILALAAFGLVSLGGTSNDVNRSSLSSSPGGALALYDLLRRSGVKVERLYRRPRRGRTDMGVAVLFVAGDEAWSGTDEKEIEQALWQADVLIRLYVDPQLPKRSEQENQRVKSPFPAFRNVRQVATTASAQQVASAAPEDLTLLSTERGRIVATISTVYGGSEVNVYDGFCFLNRFLGSADNAEFAAALISSLLPTGKKVIFPEFAYGISAPDNLFVRLGPSFTSFLIQLLFMFALLVYTLGKRFGYPEVEVPTKPGAADFINAMAEAYKRGNCTDIVLETAVERAIRITARKFNLPSDLSLDEKAARVPGELGSVLRRARSAGGRKIKPDESRRLLIELERLLDEVRATSPGIKSLP